MVRANEGAKGTSLAIVAASDAKPIRGEVAVGAGLTTYSVLVDA